MKHTEKDAQDRYDMNHMVSLSSDQDFEDASYLIFNRFITHLYYDISTLLKKDMIDMFDIGTMGLDEFYSYIKVLECLMNYEIVYSKTWNKLLKKSIDVVLDEIDRLPLSLYLAGEDEGGLFQEGGARKVPSGERVQPSSSPTLKDLYVIFFNDYNSLIKDHLRRGNYDQDGPVNSDAIRELFREDQNPAQNVTQANVKFTPAPRPEPEPEPEPGPVQDGGAYDVTTLSRDARTTMGDGRKLFYDYLEKVIDKFTIHLTRFGVWGKQGVVDKKGNLFEMLQNRMLIRLGIDEKTPLFGPAEATGGGVRLRLLNRKKSIRKNKRSLRKNKRSLKKNKRSLRKNKSSLKKNKRSLKKNKMSLRKRSLKKNKSSLRKSSLRKSKKRSLRKSKKRSLRR